MLPLFVGFARRLDNLVSSYILGLVLHKNNDEMAISSPRQLSARNCNSNNRHCLSSCKKVDFDEKDFLSYKEEGRKWDGVVECTVSGISIFTDIEGIKQLFRRVKSTRNKPILRGVLTPEHGKMLHTPSGTHQSHHTWWIPIDVAPWETFEVMELTDE
jgi:hypothetical protein